MLLLSLALIGLLQAGDPRFERLDSGLRVVVVEDHALPLVSVQLWYRVGSAHNPPGKPGLCSVVRSVLEHRDDAALKLRAAGVRFESRTERDACYFSSVLPPNFLEYVLDIEAARMKPLTVSAELADRGLNAAALQYAEVADDPNHVLMRHVLAAMFPDHPYQHPPGFVAESLKDLSPDEVNEFWRRWFVPGNATLFVIGDVSTVRVVGLVRKRFGKLEWAEAPRRAERPEPPRKRIERWNVTEHRIGVDIAWLCPSKGYFENAAIDVLVHRLCNPVDGSLSRRLFARARESLRWRRHAWRDNGILILSLDKAGHLRGLVETIEKELAEAAEQVASEIEHNRARALAERDARLRRAVFGDRARDLAEHEVVAGDLLLADFDVPRIRQIAVADVQQAALLLKESRCVVLFYGPSDSIGPGVEPIPPMEKLRDSLNLGPPEPLATGDALELLAQLGTALLEPRSPKSCPDVIVRQLDSRTRVTVCRIPDGGGATVRTVLPEIRKPPDILYRKLLSGTEQFPHDKLADYVSYRSASLLPVPNSPRAALASESPSEFIAQMMEIQASVICNPAWRGPHRLPEGMLHLLLYTKPGYLSAHTLAGVMSHGIPLFDATRGQNWLNVSVYKPLLELCRSPGSVQVYVLGNASVDEAFAMTEALWLREKEPPAEPSSRPAPEPPPWAGYWDYRHESARPTIYWIGQDSPRIHWTTHLSRHWLTFRPQEVHIRVTLRLWEEPPEDPTGLKADAVAWLLGSPPGFPRDIDGRRAWAWECRVRDANTVMISTKTSPTSTAEELAAILRRVSLVRSGDIPENEVETAIRLARATRVSLLDHQSAIADLLQRGVRSPWHIDVPLERKDLFPLATEPSLNARPMIHVVGGRERPPDLEQVGDLGSMFPFRSMPLKHP